MHGLKQSRVTAVIREVRNASTTWRHETDGLGISRREQDMMAKPLSRMRVNNCLVRYI